MVNVDGSIFIQIANFVFLIWALNAVMYKPIRNILNQRQEKISGLEGHISRALEDAEETDRAFAQGVRTARIRGLEKKEALIQEASEEEKRIVTEIQRRAQENLNQVRQQIARETQAARSSLHKEVDDFATAIGKKILGRAI